MTPAHAQDNGGGPGLWALTDRTGDQMSVLNEVLDFPGLTGGSARDRGSAPCSGRPRQEQQELAARIRALPGRFAGRMSAYTLRQVTGAAAAGRWEEAVEELIIALHARAPAAFHEIGVPAKQGPGVMNEAIRQDLGSSRARAAVIARSAHDGRGRATCRRSTAN